MMPVCWIIRLVHVPAVPFVAKCRQRVRTPVCITEAQGQDESSEERKGVTHMPNLAPEYQADTAFLLSDAQLGSNRAATRFKHSNTSLQRCRPCPFSRFRFLKTLGLAELPIALIRFLIE